MSVRKATGHDLHYMASIAAEAFIEDELVGELMHPHRKQYPNDFVSYFERHILKHWYDHNSHFLVVVEEESGKVVSFAHWQRQRQIDRQDRSSYWDTLVKYGKRSARDLRSENSAGRAI